MLSRIKFSIEPLVNEILDNLPASIWTSTTTTFCDPSIGGGQFVCEIERRLHEAGHSDKNIHSRVFGFESSALSLGYAINKYGLVGTYEVCDLLEKEFNAMKFDCIVGNPPYQGSNTIGTKQPNNHNLWSKFILLSYDLLNENGYIGFVTPDSWMSPSSKVLTLFKNNSLLCVDTQVGKYFNVGSSFTAWTFQKNKTSQTASIDGLDVDVTKLTYLPRNFAKTYPIHNKVINSNHPKIDMLSDKASSHSDYKLKNLSDTKCGVYRYKTFHSNVQTKFSKNKSKDFGKSKIIWTLSGYFKPFFSTRNLGTTEMCFYIMVDADDSEKMLSYLKSKLYRFIIYTGKWSGFLNQKVIASLPKLANKTWTDEELYKHFNLTQEEINYVEANTK